MLTFWSLLLTHIAPELANRDKGSSTYRRWSRTSCPGNGSENVYSCYAGGSEHMHTGAAEDRLRLPTNPNYAFYEDRLQPGGYVYGAEYETGLSRNLSMKIFEGIDPTVNLGNKNVPCTVCRTVRPTVLMVPARNTRTDGWTLEYKGYLSSGRHDRAVANQYACLDDQQEALDGGFADENGVVFFFVEARCGSLRCPYPGPSAYLKECNRPSSVKK